jgi:hypothetical protein
MNSGATNRTVRSSTESSSNRGGELLGSDVLTQVFGRKLKQVLHKREPRRDSFSIIARAKRDGHQADNLDC